MGQDFLDILYCISKKSSAILYTISYYNKWVKTSWTFRIVFPRSLDPFHIYYKILYKRVQLISWIYSMVDL